MTDSFQVPQMYPVSIEDEMRTSYLDYAMSVIIGRALPDVRDGLKPVHRRALYAMQQAGNFSNRGYRKSAKTVGEVIGKFHPHGDQAVYDTIVRLAQDFTMRYPLVDGQGNFGSVDGDPPAAMRYTEIRMAPLAELMLKDLDKRTVDFGPNYDNTELEPLVLPAGIPNLLANGAEGIAVGMATRIPPHNLTELLAAVRHLIEHPGCSVDELLTFVKGPDFPTAGIIYGRAGIVRAYKTGRGRIVIRGRMEFEEADKGRDKLVINELPYQVNKAQLIEEIANCVREKRIEGIADIRDESDRHGIRVVLELRRDATPKIVENQLYKHSRLQTSFGAIFLAIDSGRPKVLNLKEMLERFLAHRREVVVRRTQYLLEQAEARAHILEGLKKAIDHLDEVIALIRGSASPAEAKEQLIARFEFSDKQAQAILDMRLQRLTQLERDKLIEELEQLREKIEWYRRVLATPELVDQLVREEIDEAEQRFGDERRTEIIEDEEEIGILDVISEEDTVITVSHKDYVKRTSLTEYRLQGRGGKGTRLMEVRDGDFIESVVTASTHDLSLWFTSAGYAYRLPVYRIPPLGRAARGKAIVNLLGLRPDERIQGMLALRELEQEDFYVLTVTRLGTVKRTPLKAYANIRSAGLIALHLDEGDSLKSVHLVREQDHVFIATRHGMAIRFPASDARSMGRPARGVRGIALASGDAVVSASVVHGDEDILTVTARGYGKRTHIEEYRPQGRGGKGLLNVKLQERTGPVVAALPVHSDDEVIVATREGQVIRTAVEQDETNRIRRMGRGTRGVRVISLRESDEVVAVSRGGQVQNGDTGGAPGTDLLSSP